MPLAISFFVPIELSAEMSEQQQAATPAAPAVPATPSEAASQMQQQAAASTSVPATPAQQTSKAGSPDEILKQAQLLAEQNKQYRAQLERLSKLEKNIQDKHQKEWLPRAEQYIKQLEEDQGKALSEDQKNQIRETFTAVDDELQENAKALWQQHNKRVELTASKAAAEEQARLMAEENKKLKENLNMVSQSLQNGMRAGYANTMMATIDASKTAPAPAAPAQRVSVNEIFVPQVAGSPQEEKALKKRGFLASTKLDVNASANDEFYPFKPFAQSLPAPPTHNNMFEEDGTPKNRESWRYTNKPFFAAMNDPRTMNMGGIQDFSNFDVRIVSDARYTFLERTEGTDANLANLV